jgi:hypothetical protein
VKIKSQKDFWSGVMFVVVGAAFAWGALNYNFGSSARPGPGYFPLGLGMLLALLGGLAMFEAMTIDTEDGEPIGAIAWKPLLVVVAALAGFGFILPRLGMVISLPLLVVVISLAGDEFHWKDAVINALVLLAVSWGVFVKGLALTIPVWPTVFSFSGS